MAKAPKKKIAKKSTAPKAAPKKTVKKAVKKAAPKKTVKKVVKRAAPKKAVVKKAIKKAAPKKAVVKKAIKKAAPKKAVVKKVAKKKAAKKIPAKRLPSGSHGFKAAPFMKSPKKAKAVRHKKTQKSKLTKRDIAVFQRLLLEKRHSLVGDLADLEAGSLGRNLQESAGDLSTAPTHPADLGTDNFEQEFTLGLMESERALLNEIDEALERIENSEYGICQGTGEPISKARLNSRPWCKFSIEYKRLVEKGLIDHDEEDGAI